MNTKKFGIITILAVTMLLSFVRMQESTNKVETDEKTLREDFNNLDKNQDGYVDVHELRSAMPGVQEDDLSAFFDRYDADRDGVLTLEEYFTVTTTK